MHPDNKKKGAASEVSMRTLRWLTAVLQATFLLGLPFVRLHGESVLRFDLGTLRLHFFGATLWMHEFFLVLVATLFLVLFVVFVTLVFGRVWCGWLCPQTVTLDFTFFVDRMAKKGLPARAVAVTITFVLAALIAASLIWYFVSPYEFFALLAAGALGTVTWGFWIVCTLIFFLDFTFLRYRWCATVCPYAKLQSVLFDKSTLIIELDPRRADECIDCRRCLRACPTGVDIRKGLDAACINCAACIDACRQAMGKRGKKSLIRYAFGPGDKGGVIRPAVVVVGGLLLCFFIFLVFLASGRTGVEVTVLPHMMEPRLTKDQRVINAYVLAVQNMRPEPIELTVRVEIFDPTLVQSGSNPLRLAPGSRDRFPLFVRIAKPAGATAGTRRIQLHLDNQAENIHLLREANFTIPDEL